MTRSIARCGSAATATIMLTLLLPAMSSATPEIGGHDNGWNLCEERALSLYAQGAKQGLDLGRNRIDDGKLLKSGEAVPEPHPCQWRDQLDLILHPPAPPAPAAPSSVSVAPVATAPAAPTSSSSAPVDINCESGGDYSINTGNGYYGAYQFDSTTWDAYGDPAYGEANEAPPAVQDAAAASVPYDAWPNC